MKLFSLALFLTGSLAFSSVAHGAPIGSTHDPLVLRTYPEANAIEISPQTQIGITAAGMYLASSVTVKSFSVTGARTGHHEGVVLLSIDRATAIFRPSVPFEIGEMVDVRFSATMVGNTSISDHFTFTTSVKRLVPFTASELAHHLNEGAGDAQTSAKPGLNNDRPLGFPPLVVTVDDAPLPGKIFMANAGGPPPSPGEPNTFLIILNEHGVPLAGTTRSASDFEQQPNGAWTYCTGQGAYVSVDTNFEIIDSFTCANGVSVDGHELLVDKQGNYTILGLQKVTMDMSKLVAGGNAQAVVTTNVIQSFDRKKNLLFEWRGIDHYSVLDANHVDLTAATVDFEHANSIDIDVDGNYLLSNRHLSEITKINGNTGEIMWRFGGKKNQFALKNDTMGFSYQHFARWLPNGHLLFYDNGNYNKVQESRAVEYVMDQKNMTATLVWQFRHSPPTYGFATGSAQRLVNGNTLIDWGIDKDYAATEVTPSGKVTFELTMPSDGSPAFSYRILKYVEGAPIPNEGVNESPKPLQGSLTVLVSTREVTVTLESESSKETTIEIFDASGRRITELFDGLANPGVQQCRMATTSLASATYFCVARSSDGATVRPFTVVR